MIANIHWIYSEEKGMRICAKDTYRIVCTDTPALTYVMKVYDSTPFYVHTVKLPISPPGAYSVNLPLGGGIIGAGLIGGFMVCTLYL